MKLTTHFIREVLRLDLLDGYTCLVWNLYCIVFAFETSASGWEGFWQQRFRVVHVASCTNPDRKNIRARSRKSVAPSDTEAPTSSWVSDWASAQVVARSLMDQKLNVSSTHPSKAAAYASGFQTWLGWLLTDISNWGQQWKIGIQPGINPTHVLYLQPSDDADLMLNIRLLPAQRKKLKIKIHKENNVRKPQLQTRTRVGLPDIPVLQQSGIQELTLKVKCGLHLNNTIHLSHEVG